MANIGSELQIYAVLKERLQAQYDLEDDDQALIDSLDGMSPLREIVVGLIREARRSDAFSKGIDSIIADNRNRKSRLDNKVTKLRSLAAWIMEEINLPKIEEPDMTISRRQGKPSVIITNENVVPDIFCKIIKEPSKTKIREAMELGQIVPGAEWSNTAPVLTVKSK